MNTKSLSTLVASLAVFASACSSTRAQSPVEVRTHTAGDPGFRVNSHLVLGARDALLVDAQFTRSEARKLVEEIRASGRELRTIFITHAHPDHYLGLETLVAAFPGARILARPETIAEMKETAPGKLSYWKGLYKDDLADRIVYPQAFTGTELTVDGAKIELLAGGEGESAHATALYVPSLRAMITGDLVYSQVHFWLAEERPESWLASLAKLRVARPVEQVLPGHGPVGGPELFDASERYIRDYLGATKGLNKSQTKLAIDRVLKLYPGFALPIILELSVGARLAK